MPTLALELAGNLLRTAKLFKPMTTIGASSDNDIRVEHAGLESTHAQITREPDGLYVVGMTRDMTVNGRREKRKKLEHHDIIRIGDLKLVYFTNDDEAPQPRPSGKAAPAGAPPAVTV